MAKPDYKVTGSSPVKVTGMPPTGDFANDIDRLDGGIEAIDGEGTQGGEHPAKTQQKVMRYI